MPLPLIELLPLLVLGAGAGFLAGLLGVGGGMIMVPFVTMLLERHAFPPGQIIKVAIATSLTTIMFTAISSVRAHHRHAGVRWEIAAVLAPGILVGSFAGAQFVGALPAGLIAGIFGTFLIWAATRMLRHQPAQAAAQVRQLPGRSGMFSA
ncbi:MAG: sulfite exporter TauE/SafE family protein, partial [Quisquiliibacterium sp.]